MSALTAQQICPAPLSASDDGNISKEWRRPSDRRGKKASRFDRWILRCLINAEARWEPVAPVWLWGLACVQLEVDLRTADACRHIPEVHADWKAGKLLKYDHLTALFELNVWRCMYNTTVIHWGELLYPVVSPAVGYYFSGDLIK